MKFEPRRPHAATLAICLTAAFASSCGSSHLGNRDDNQTPSGSPRSVSLVNDNPNQNENVRVDLPGRVSVFVKVTNSNGTPASGLTGADFNIFEDGALVSQSESFQQIRPQPQVFRSYVHLVLDRSNSVQSQGAMQVQDSAREFIELLMPENESSSSTHVRISWFAGTPDIEPIPGYDIGFSNDRALLLEAINELNSEDPTSVSTNLYGAVDQGLDALDEVDMEAEADNVPNRALALVTFTDGTHQTGGPLTPGDLAQKIADGSTLGTSYSAFTIGVGQEIDAGVLAALGPNGSVAAAQFDVLQEAFENVGRQVRDLANSFYFLTYCSPKRGGQYDLTVSVVEDPNSAGNITVPFNSDSFGSGCAFLDVIRHGDDLSAPGERLFITDAVELSTGQVVVSGWRSSTCLFPGCGQQSRAFVARFLASDENTLVADVQDGRLDGTFGNGGVLFLGNEAPALDVSGATSLTRDPVSGELIVGGWARENQQSGFSSAALWRISADGSTVDRIDVASGGSFDEAITSVERTAGGEILAGGFRGTGARSFALWRFFPNLVPDTSFGSGGVALFPAVPENGVDREVDLVLGGNDRVYAVGRANSRVRVVALNQVNGAVDNSFGGDGVVQGVSTFNGIDHQCTPKDAMLDGSGRLLIGGSFRDSSLGGRDQPALWRILDTGAPDQSFTGSPSSPSSGTGVVTLRSTLTSNQDRDFGRDTRIDGIDLAANGTIMATGTRSNGQGHSDLATFAFDSEGRAEGDYNLIGFVIHDGAASDDSFEGGSLVRVLASGAIWCIGTSNSLNPETISGTGAAGDIPTVWVDRDIDRAFAPLGTQVVPGGGEAEK